MQVLKNIFRKKQVLLSLLTLMCAPFFAQATLVQLETAFGNFEVNLYDNATPETVANFLQYVDQGDYANTVIHRTVDNFIIQGGGFAFNENLDLNDSNLPLTNINALPAINNEAMFSNVRGTIAMAKLGNNVNSATNQWFFNLADNSLNLDRQNGGFTVFGQVTGNGMAIIDQIAAIERFDFGGAFTSIPLQNFDSANPPDSNNLIIISNIQVVDATVDTAAGLSPPLNIGPPAPPEPIESSGGGSASWLLFLGLILMRAEKRKKFCNYLAYL